MRILIEKARIIAPGQALNGRSCALLIEQGQIKQVAEHLDVSADKVVSYPNLHLSPGWMDPFAHFCDPGLEYKETLETGAAAAAAGGYTTILVLPNTLPPLDTRTQIEYIRRRSDHLPVSIFPIGAISKGLEGKALAEMYDMSRAGAAAFSDGLHPVQTSGLLLKALQYVKAFKGIIIQVPDDRSISQYGLMHEGIWSTRLGMSGIPDIAEATMIKRDLDLLRYSESRMHITGLSLAKSIALIRAAKEEGLAVTTSVTPYHLNLTDQHLQEFDSNYKVTPPLRDWEDVVAIRKALKEGVIDCLATHHFPQDMDSKNKEFEYASSGMIGLETAFGLLGKTMPELTTEEKVSILAIRSRKSFGISIPQIEEGATAELTFFDPDMAWEYHNESIHSKSRNTPFDNTQLKGKPLGIVHKNNLFLS